MIEEAIVDAHTEFEQAVGFHATMDQYLELPFATAGWEWIEAHRRWARGRQ